MSLNIEERLVFVFGYSLGCLSNVLRLAEVGDAKL